MKKMLLLAAFLPLTAQAADFYNYSGRIISEPAGVPLESSSAQFNIDLKIGSCVVYREVHSNVSVSSGYFNIKIGKGSSPQGAGIDIFDNKSYNCIGGGTQVASAPLSRKAVVQVQDGATSIEIGEIELGAMGQSLQALKLDGLSKDDLIQVTGNVDQAKMEELANMAPDLAVLINDKSSGANASQQDLQTLQQSVSSLSESISTGLSTKVEQSTLSSALQELVSNQTFQEEVNNLNSAVGLRATQDDLTAGLALKADASLLSSYALQSAVNSALDLKVSKIANCGANEYLVSSSAVSAGIACQSMTAISSKLQVNGAIVGKDVVITNGSVDFDAANSVSSSLACAGTAAGASAGDFRLNNLRAGGTYSLVVTSSNATKCTFQTAATVDGSAVNLTYYFSPPLDVRSGVAGERTIYSFLRVGTDVYVSWSTGFKAGQ